MDNTYPIQQTCPHCEMDRGYLRGVTFSETVKSFTFRCEACGAKWVVASDAPIAPRLRLVPKAATPQGMR